MNSLVNRKNIAFWFSSIFLIILYAYVGYTSYGFDDEFFNIFIVEKFSTYEIFYLDPSLNINHPNGSIFINSILFNFLDDWSFVRAFYGVIFALSLLFSFACLVNKSENFNQLFFFILMCLNPSLLMIGSSLRWYSLFIIFINFLIILIYKNTKNPLIFWGTFLILAQILLHTNYLAFIILPVVFLYTLHKRKDFLYNSRIEFIYLILFLLLSFIIASPEINSLLFKLSLDQSNQTSSFLMSIIGFGIFQSSGLAFMPNSFPGLLSIIISFCILSAFLFNIRNQSIKFLPIYLFICLAILFTGLAGKFRTFFTIHILDAYIKTQILSHISKKWHSAILLLLIVPVLAGTYNVITHQATNKGSWNMPYLKTINKISEQIQNYNCEKTQIFLHDPGLMWHLDNLQYDVLNIYNEDNIFNLYLSSDADCHIYLSTFLGSMDPARKGIIDSFFNNNLNFVKKINIQKDRFTNIKRVLNKDIPDYYVELSVYKQINGKS